MRVIFPKLRLGTGNILVITALLKAAQEEEIRTLFETDNDGHWIGEKLLASANGIEVLGKHGYFVYAPFLWSDFLNEASLPADFYAVDLNAAATYRCFQQWELNWGVTDLLRAVGAGEVGFRAAIEAEPKFGDHPLIQREIAKRYLAGTMPPEKRGRKKIDDPRALELYGWACWIYVNEDVSRLEACHRACERYSHLIPETWGEGKDEIARVDSAPDTLNAYINKFDQLPGHSMKAYRESKTKKP